MTIAPNPFQILDLVGGQRPATIRLGTAVATAAYWHPINLAGEAAFLDLISGGRLEFGIGSGAYQREFDRMRPGLKQSDAWQYMQEMLPARACTYGRATWPMTERFGSFPDRDVLPQAAAELTCRSGSRRARRSPLIMRCAKNAMSCAGPSPGRFLRPKLYKQQLDAAVQKADNGFRPTFAMMRHAAVYTNDTARRP